MELEIVYLYHDLLNSYGDEGNIKILKKRAESRGILVKIQKVSVGDSIKSADILFIGGGQDKEQKIACEDLKKTKKEFIKEYMKDGGCGLFVCSGYQIMGDYYFDESENKIKGASILPLHTEYTKERVTGNIFVRNSLETLVGFENHSGKTYLDGGEALGEVILGFGNNGSDKTEGCVYKNFYGTYMHGPLLSKNPALSDNLIRSAMIRKYGSFVLEPLDDSFELLAKKKMTEKFLK